MPVTISGGADPNLIVPLVREQEPVVVTLKGSGGSLKIAALPPAPVAPAYLVALQSSATLTAIGAATQARVTAIGAAAATHFLAAVVQARSAQMQAGATVSATGARRVSRRGEIAASAAVKPIGAQVEARSAQTSSTAELQPVGGRIVSRTVSITVNAATSFVGEAVSGAWTPANLFSATDKGFAFDLIDLSGANTLSDQTGTTPGAGDPLGYLPGISPNAKTATQSVSAERPTVQVNASGQNYLAFDSTDILSTTEDMANDTWTVWMVYEPDGGDFICVSQGANGAPWIGIGEQINVKTTFSSGGITSVKYWYDNTLFTGSTRGDSWEAAQASNLATVEGTTDGTSWTSASIGDYLNLDQFSTPGKTYAWGAINRALTSTERADLLAYADYVRGV